MWSLKSFLYLKIKNHFLQAAWVILDPCGFFVHSLAFACRNNLGELCEERPVESEMASYAVFIIL